MLEYCNNKKEMENLFRKHKDDKKWIHTGDIGYVDEDGFLFLVGRMKRILILGHAGIRYKVYPQMIEEIIIEADDIQTACVVSIEEEGNSVAKAYVVIKKDCNKAARRVLEDIQKMCNDKLPEYTRPKYYEFLDELLLTAAGKVDYKALEG